MLVSSTLASWKSAVNGGKIQNVIIAPNGGQEPADLVFATSTTNCTNGNYLNFETESYASSTGSLVDWVQVPSMSAGATIYVCYDASNVDTDQSHSSSTWTSNYLGVWHMNDNAASTVIRDSTSNGINATNGANTNTKTSSGQISSALSYDGSSDFSRVAVDLSSVNVITRSYWINWSSFANNDQLQSEYNTNSNNSNAFLDDPNTTDHGGGWWGVDMTKTDHSAWADVFERPSAGAWHYITVVQNRAIPANTVYVDGVQQSLTLDLHFGSDFGNFGNFTWYWMSRAGSSLLGAGNLEEMRLSDTALSSQWVFAEYSNQANPDDAVSSGGFYHVGTESSFVPSPSGLYYALNIAKSFLFITKSFFFIQ